MLDRPRAACLIPGDRAGDEADQVEDVSPSDAGVDWGAVKAWPGGDPQGRVFEPSAFEGIPNAGLRREQRRGTRTQGPPSLNQSDSRRIIMLYIIYYYKMINIYLI